MTAAGISKHIRKAISHISTDTLLMIFQHDPWCFSKNLGLLTRAKVRFLPNVLDRLCEELQLGWTTLPLPVLRHLLFELDAGLRIRCDDERGGAAGVLFRQANEIAYWLAAGNAPRLLDRKQASWAWCQKTAASWIDGTRPSDGTALVNPYSWVSALGAIDLIYFVAQPISDSRVLAKLAIEFENCLENTRFVLDALADRARYFVMQRKPEMSAGVIVRLVRDGNEWIVGELQGPANADPDLYAQAQATSLARLYSEAWRNTEPHAKR